jgi:LacI family transcriptional regulator, gluconate utilization system Gnt-I transcriptional repressor
LTKNSTSYRATIKDVAEKANVSLMTVSRAVRGLNGISETTRQRVLQVVQELNYVPNGNARALVQANSKLIGLSLPTLFNDVFADALLGMRRTIEQAGYSCLLQTTDYDTEREAKWTDQLLEWRPAAVIMTGVDHHARVRSKLRGENIPTLEIWDVTDDPIDICVGIDHLAAGHELGAHVAQLGYRKPAFVGPPEGDDPRADKRVAGLIRAFRSIGSDPLQRITVEPNNAFLMGQQGFDALPQTNRPDVVFFLNDHIAFGGMMAAERAGLNVPNDLGIVGFNGLDLNHVLARPMTTMSTPRRQMGLVGARHLLARLSGIAPPRNTHLPCTLCPGQTTRAQ